MLGIEIGYTRRMMDLAMFTRHVAGAMAARAPLAEVVAGYAEEADTRRMQLALTSIVPRLQAGVPLSEAMAGEPGTFPESYRAILYLGERSDTLPSVMNGLAQSLEEAVINRESFRRAAIYPTIILTLLLFMSGFFTVMLVPKVTDIWLQLGGGLDTNAVLNPWLLYQQRLVLTLLLVAVLWLYAAGAGIRWSRERAGRWLMMMPLIGAAIRHAETSNFMRHLGLMLGSRVPLSEALTLLADSSSNGHARDAFLEFRDRVEKGEDIRSAIGSVTFFPASVAVLIGSAQERGNLEETLLQLASFYRERTQHSLRLAREFFEPIMLLLTGVIIGWTALVIYTPFLRIAEGVFRGW